MGRDGLVGTAQIKGKSGHCLTESEETRTVFGMAVGQGNLSNESVPPEQLTGRFHSIVSGAPR